eukprot:6195715-Pleurochrysis_carterae.AAC.2
MKPGEYVCCIVTALKVTAITHYTETSATPRQRSSQQHVLTNTIHQLYIRFVLMPLTWWWSSRIIA